MWWRSLVEGLEPFPPPEQADEDGLVAVGGELSAPRLLLAYSTGIFPWFEEGMPVLWWSPDPRAVLDLDAFHAPRRLMRLCRQGRFQVSFDQQFEAVMKGCAENRPDGTWITASMIDAYTQLHQLGYAHSVEVWQGDELVGGVYGVAIGAMFSGESMFHRRSSAANVALVHLVDRLRRGGFLLFDVQVLNPHTARFGAVNISRRRFLRRLEAAIGQPAHFGADPAPSPN